MQIEVIKRTSTEPIVTVFRPGVSPGSSTFEIALCPEVTGQRVCAINGTPVAGEFVDVTRSEIDFESRFDHAMCRWAFPLKQAAA